jgi:hypothetical protein
MDAIRSFLSAAYTKCDYIPVASTAKGLVDLFTKYVVMPFKEEETIKSTRYYSHLRDSDSLRSVVILVPILGNIVIACADLNNNPSKKSPVDLKSDLSKKSPVDLKSNLSEKPPVDLLCSFYEGSGKDIKNRALSDIWSWDDQTKEKEHDYIQWMFPIATKSRFNSKAPVLTREIADQLKSSEQIMCNFRTSFNNILNFYGYKDYTSGSKELEKADNFDSRVEIWAKPGNHNLDRITRIMKCLKIMGMRDELSAFYGSLLSDVASRVGETALPFWKEAANLHIDPFKPGK